MSGLAGVVHFDGRPVTRALLDCMAAAAPHRGPDGTHHWIGAPSWSVPSMCGAGTRRSPAPEGRPDGLDPCSDLGVDAEVDQQILDMMLSRTSLGEIARELLTRFPDRFDRFQAAQEHVADLSVRYKS